MHFSLRNKPQESSRTYQYQPLPSEQHIRLLRLHPGSKDAPLLAVLETYHINDCPNYSAVSYTWGTAPASFNIGITLEDAPAIPISRIAIRPSLHRFLTWLRGPEYDRMLWVDAICINQQSNREKNHQVRLMGRIYKQANIVQASLASDTPGGDHASNIKKAFKFMASVVEHCIPGRTTIVRSSRQPSTAEEYFNNQTHAKAQHQHFFNKSSTSSDVWTSFEKFCEQPYWGRKWIIQEVILAKSIVLHMDGVSFPMKTVEDFFEQVRDNPYALTSDTTAQLHHAWKHLYASKGLLTTSPVSILARHRRNLHKGNPVPVRLHELLPHYSLSNCSVKSDHVYALLNLMADHKKYLEVNYNQDVMQRTATIVKFLLKHDGIRPSDAIPWAIHLLRMFEADQSAPMDGVPISRRPCVMLLKRMAWTVSPKGESPISRLARRNIRALRAMSTGVIGLKAKLPSVSLESPRSTTVTYPQAQVFFTIEREGLYGLADQCRQGDELWQVDGTGLLFVVRRLTDVSVRIIGRAILFTSEDVASGKRLDLRHMRDVLEAVSADVVQFHHASLSNKDVLMMAQMAIELGVSDQMVPLSSRA